MEALPRQARLPASVRAEVSPASGTIICHICTGLVAVTECDSSVLPSQAPLGFRETWAHEGPDPCVCWFWENVKIFFVERDLLTLIFIVNGAEEHLSTSSMNRVFCVWVRGHIPAAS